MRRALLALMALSQPLSAQTAPGTTGATDWMQQQTQTPLKMRIIGSVPIAPGGVIVADPLTYAPGPDWTVIPAPEGPALFIVYLDANEGRLSKAMLLFAPGSVACGHDEATVGVDTGLAAFLDQPAAAALAADNAAYADRGLDLYENWWADRFGSDPVIADRFPLPSGPEIPIFSSGWGDGGYPVASLYDAEGRMVALYADFMGRNDAGEWLLPDECPGPDLSRVDPPAFPPSNL